MTVLLSSLNGAGVSLLVQSFRYWFMLFNHSTDVVETASEAWRNLHRMKGKDWEH